MEGRLEGFDDKFFDSDRSSGEGSSKDLVQGPGSDSFFLDDAVPKEY